MNQAVGALGALAQGTRLAIFRLLVEAGPEGIAAGRIGEKLDLPPATLSFHLSQLARAGVAKGRSEGRFVIYSADFAAMNELVAYLTENCCNGGYCEPAVAKSAIVKLPERTARARRR